MPPTPKGNRDLIRAINRSIVLNTIKSRVTIDRAQVARLTGLSPATVTGITSELIDEGLIFEKEPGDSRGGRPPILLAMNPRGGFVIGIKLMEDHALGALTDLEATVIVKDCITLTDRTAKSAVDTLVSLIDRLIAAAGVPRHKLIGVGIGLAGIVDFEHGVLRQSPFFGWRDLPLADMIQPRVEVPVILDNDVNTLTLAEQWFGAGQGVEDFLTLTVGRGIGLGIVTHGQFYRGAGGGAGEFGHISVDPSGPTCDCGKHGCLETFAGYPGLLRAARAAFLAGKLPADPHSVVDLLAQAEAGSPAAARIFHQAGARLGQQVANLINLFNPALIIVGGEGVQLGDWLFEPMRQSIHECALPHLLEDVQIRIEPWGDDVWARGAASLVLRQLFESPVHNAQTSVLS